MMIALCDKAAKNGTGERKSLYVQSCRFREMAYPNRFLHSMYQQLNSHVQRPWLPPLLLSHSLDRSKTGYAPLRLSTRHIGVPPIYSPKIASNRGFTAAEATP